MHPSEEVLEAARKLVDEAEGIETVTLDPAAHAAAAAFVDAEQRRAAPVIAYLPWARIVCEIAQDYKCDLTFEAAVFAAMYKLVANDNFIDLMVKELKRSM